MTGETAPATGAESSGGDDQIRIGISACLLGQEVRYDGGHKRDRFLTDVLGPFVTFVPVCPEAELGLGIPRETIRLERDGDAVRLVGTRSGTDRTDAMRTYARRRVRELEPLGLCGYVLKKGSPSCGMERVPVRGRGGSRTGRGLFAEELLGRLSDLPVEEEGRLRDPGLRENFLERVFAYRRLARFLATRFTVGDLVRFHTDEKLLLMAHDPVRYRALGRLVAGAKGRPRDELRAEYRTEFLAALRRIATVKKHVDVLTHVLGHFKKRLPADDRRELLGLIEDYRRGLVPLIVPVTLVRHHVRREGVEYLRGQTYLEPSPPELMLRNHV